MDMRPDQSLKDMAVVGRGERREKKKRERLVFAL
jgi:hypothetical protein